MDTEGQDGERSERPAARASSTLSVEEGLKRLQTLANAPAGALAGIAVWSWGRHWQACVLDRDGKMVKGVGLLDTWRDTPGEAVHAIVMQARAYAARAF